MVYRNLGSYESIVGDFATNQNTARSGSTVDAGIRWFELRKSGGGNWTLYQEGTFSPGDSNTHHLEGSLATDKNGNIGMGYNVTKTRLSGRVRQPALHRAQGGRSCRRHDRGRDRHRHRRGRRDLRPLGRLLLHRGRSGGRLHLLDGRHVPAERQLGHAHRQLQVRRLRYCDHLLDLRQRHHQRRRGHCRRHGEQRQRQHHHQQQRLIHPGQPRQRQLHHHAQPVRLHLLAGQPQRERQQRQRERAELHRHGARQQPAHGELQLRHQRPSAPASPTAPATATAASPRAPGTSATAPAPAPPTPATPTPRPAPTASH